MAKTREAPAFEIKGLKTTYPIYVETPPEASAGGEAATGPWITVLCLDGDDQFEDLRKARQVLAKTEEVKLPPLLLVGIGYGASYGKPGNQRVRDYSPVPLLEEGGAGGEADAFLEFLKGTVWPELEKRYRVDPEIRGVAGYSLGALFALHALFKPEPFFNRVLAASPSVWWGERAVLNAVTAVQDQKIPLRAKLFVSVGLKDSKSMVGDLDMLEAQLEARPVQELHVSRARFPEHNHFNAIAVSFRMGLAELFGA